MFLKNLILLNNISNVYIAPNIEDSLMTSLLEVTYLRDQNIHIPKIFNKCSFEHRQENIVMQVYNFNFFFFLKHWSVAVLFKNFFTIIILLLNNKITKIYKWKYVFFRLNIQLHQNNHYLNDNLFAFNSGENNLWSTYSGGTRGGRLIPGRKILKVIFLDTFFSRLHIYINYIPFLEL